MDFTKADLELIIPALEAHKANIERTTSGTYQGLCQHYKYLIKKSKDLLYQ